MSVLVLVVDDEPDVEALFRQQFRRDLRAERFVMDFAICAADALSRIAPLRCYALSKASLKRNPFACSPIVNLPFRFL